MTKIKVLIGATLAVALLALGVAQSKLQEPVVAATGQIILENTIGGIPFDCRMRPTGHFRDANFCDVFHACIHGFHRKTYSCPIVGERTYFDEITQRCEFVHLNPNACATFSV